MKRFSTILLVLTLFGNCVHVASASDASTWMPDANLRAAVRKSLGLADNEDLTQAKMLDLTELKAAGRGISDLTGLEHATSVTVVRLAGNQISNISPLSGVTSVTKLRLQGNEITNITSLSGLTNLTELFLNDNQITDVAPLTSLVNLGTLRLAGNSLTNAHVLSSLTNLNSVDISIPDPPQDSSVKADPPPPETPADADPPRVSISVPSGVQNGAFSVTITFTETVSGFTQSDVSLTGSAASITTWSANSDSTVYTATVTPAASGTVTIGVSANVANDAANNQNTAATSKTVAVDVDKPTVTIGVPAGTQSGAFNATITFSETISGFTQSDLSLSGTASASITGWSANSDTTVYTATITPTASGSVTIGAAANVSTDAANNSNIAATSKTVTVDVDAPGVSISVPSDVQNGVFDATITFTEVVSNFTQEDVGVSGAASITTWSTSDDTTYTATITPTGSGLVTLSIAAGVATDVASNQNTAATAQTVALDVDSPTTTIGVPSGTQTGAFDATITFSEAVSDFVRADVSLTGSAASITGWSANTENTVYTATIIPTTSGTVTLSVAAGVATDTASNPNTAATPQTVTIAMPELVQELTTWMPDANLRKAVRKALKLASDAIFSQEDMQSLTHLSVQIRIKELTGLEHATQLTELNVRYSDIGDISPLAGLTSLTILDLRGNNINDVTPLAKLVNLEKLWLSENPITDISPLAGLTALRWLVIMSANVSDVTPLAKLVNLEQLLLAGNSITDFSPLSNLNNLQYADVEIPEPESLEVSISVPSDVQNGAFDATITFSEAVSDFVQADVSLGGSAASITSWSANSDNTVYTAAITPTASGTVTVGVAASVATDAANNPNTAATSKTVSVDVDKPTVAIGVPSGAQIGAFDATITFSERVSGFTQSEVSLTGSAASITSWSANSNNTIYTATITPTASGTVTVGVAANVATDAANNSNTAATSQTVIVDVDKPGVSISVASGVQNGVFNATITFTEAVLGFVQSDVSLSGSAASITSWSANTANTVYTATITPTASGAVTIGVAANVATDAANNSNTAATSQTVTVDVDKPGVSISVPSGVQNGVFNATITFTEAVLGFVQSDVSLTGSAASITSLSANSNNAVYTATITQTASGTVIVGIAAGVATDAASNQNTTATSQTVRVDVDAPSVSISVPSGDQTGAFDVTITFTEAVSGFEQSEFSLAGTANPSITAWSTTDNTTYTAEITPGTSGNVTLSVPAGVASDAASNPNTASTTQTVTAFVFQLSQQVGNIITVLDIDPLAISITVPEGVQNGAFEATITFTAVVSGFEQTDVSLTGTATASITTWVASSDNTTYTATITPTTSGTVTLNVAANVATDAANNPNTAATSQTVNIDIDAPGVSITVPSDPQNSAFEATITFSEPVSGFEQTDVSLTGTATASITAWVASSDNTTYTATITPTTSGTVTLNVAAGVASDAANNANTAATSQTVNIDVDSPSVGIEVPETPQNGAFEATITFTEAVSGFEQSDVSLSGTVIGKKITAWSTMDNITYTLTIIPQTHGTVILSIDEGVATDAASNPNTAATPQTVSVDPIQPSVYVFGPLAVQNGAFDRFTDRFTEAVSVFEQSAVQNGAFDVIIRFTEAVSGFEQSDVSLSGTATASVTAWNTSDNITYTAQITPTSSGEVTLSVPASVATDAANNANTASAPKTVSIDVDRPGVSISVPSGVQNGAFNVEITFTEKILGFEQSDLLLEDSTIATLITEWATTDDITYTLTITPAASGTITLNIAEDGATDIAANANTAAQTQTVSVVQEQTFVFVTDTNLEIGVRRALGLGSGVFITPEAMLGLTALDLGFPNSNPLPNLIASLTGLEYATNLTELDLGSHSLNDISHLAGLTNLTTLYLDDNSISDISAIEDLTNLTTLGLSHNSISDVSAIEDLTNLTTLDLRSNIISDISPLSGLTNLTSLHLDRNRINDATPLASLVNLETLWLSGNPLSPNPPAAMASMLTTLTQLTNIDIKQPDSNALIPDPVLARGIRSRLGLEENAEITAEAMLNLTSLRSNIPGDVYSLVGLEHATNLTDIKLHGHIINDLSPLANLTSLTTLEISSTRGALSDLSPLANLTNLTELRLFINGISDLSPLANLTVVTELTLFRNNIEDLGPLTHLVNLKRLSLSNNDISDVTPLARLVNLRRLELHGNSILDTSSLYSLTQTEPVLHCTIAITEYPPWDVNEDGSVDASDSALVTVALGQTGSDIVNPRTDVDGDGTVDNEDVTLVTDNLDTDSAPPSQSNAFTSLDREMLEKMDSETIAAQLEILRTESDGSLKYLRAIELLENILAAMRPAETLLLANYPNPFNPETWIPYQLANDGDVQISIYDTKGALVRQLELGHQRAGYFRDRSRAVYWDGRNDFGERVVTGIYFYQLQTDNLSLLRKMVILK